MGCMCVGVVVSAPPPSPGARISQVDYEEIRNLAFSPEMYADLASQSHLGMLYAGLKLSTLLARHLLGNAYRQYLKGLGYVTAFSATMDDLLGTMVEFKKFLGVQKLEFPHSALSFPAAVRLGCAMDVCGAHVEDLQCLYLEKRGSACGAWSVRRV